ncbi:unnamed protein product, partial [Prorocentrum cordatum]
MWPAGAVVAICRGRPFAPPCEGSATRPESADVSGWATWPRWRSLAVAIPVDAFFPNPPILAYLMIVLRVSQVLMGLLVLLLRDRKAIRRRVLLRHLWKDAYHRRRLHIRRLHLRWTRLRTLDLLEMFTVLVIALYALRHGCLLVLRPRRRLGRWRLRLPLLAVLLPRPWPRLRIVDLLVMFTILVLVLYALRQNSLLVRRPRRRHVAGRFARPLSALLLLGPRLRNLELLVVLSTLLAIVTYALRHVCSRSPFPALLLPKPGFRIISIVLFAQNRGYLLEVRSALLELLPPRPRPRLRHVDTLVLFAINVIVLYDLRHDRLLVLRWADAPRRAPSTAAASGTAAAAAE